MFAGASVVLAAAAFQTAPAIASDLAPVVRIEVRGDRSYTRPHAIIIGAQTETRSRSVAEREAGVWIATREWDGGAQTLTSTDCPAIRSIVTSVEDLPPARIAPPTLGGMLGEPLPLPPTIKDGFETSLTFPTVTNDGSRGEVTVARGNVYQLWGHNAVASLIPCWGPLTP